MNCLEKFDYMTELLGPEEFLNVLYKALNKWELEELLDMIARDYDVNFNETMEDVEDE